MTNPWNSDISLDNSQITRLAERMPGLKVNSIQKLDQGWDNEVYLVNEELIFRFVRRVFVIPFVQTEIKALNLLEGRITCPIPKILYNGTFKPAHSGQEAYSDEPQTETPDYPYFVYTRLPGSMIAGLQLSDAEKQRVILPITGFMNELHQIPLTEEIRANIPKDTIGRLDIAKRTKQIRDKIYVTEKLGVTLRQSFIEDLLSRVSQPSVDQTNCLVHGDLYAKNILTTNRNMLSAIIDWSDIHVGHPAKDFAFAVSFFNPVQLTQVMNKYTLFDRALFHLSIFGALSHTCHLAEYAIDIKDGPLIEECKGIFANLQRNYDSFS